MEFPVVPWNSGDEPNKANTKKRQVPKVYYTKIKQNVIAGWAPATTTMMVMTTVMGSQCLIPGAVAGVIGPLHLLQDHVHCPQDVTSRSWILGDPRDRGHTQIL
jgi:hypothetical protein